ncbi:MAG TPA: hypothetical protein VF389_01330 [Woeseiaceae bacterium]
MTTKEIRNELLCQAEAIIDRAANTKALLGVFVQGGKLKATRTTTGLFERAMKERPGRLVGCYDAHGSPLRIVEDALETVTWPGAVAVTKAA